MLNLGLGSEMTRREALIASGKIVLDLLIALVVVALFSVFAVSMLFFTLLGYAIASILGLFDTLILRFSLGRKRPFISGFIQGTHDISEIFLLRLGDALSALTGSGEDKKENDRS